MTQSAKRFQSELKIMELRRLIEEGHASGVVDWTSANSLIARARKAAGL